MKAADVYRRLDGVLRPSLEVLGFARRRASRLTYARQARQRYETVWFQCDKWGWDAFAGSSFFVNVTVSRAADVDAAPRREERLNHFVTPEELEAASTLRNGIVSRIPKPHGEYFANPAARFSGYRDGPAMLAAVRQEFEPDTTPYSEAHDLALRYYDADDIAAWAAFIAPVLPRTSEAMSRWDLP